jgi:hypothetical protein
LGGNTLDFDYPAFLMDEEELTPEEKQAISDYHHKGISYEVDWDAYDTDDDSELKTIAIHWHPGDPDPLAESIIEEVKERTGLILDGHRYWIEPQ